MISVLDDKSRGDNFTDNTYLPWLEKYMQNLIGVVEKKQGRKSITLL